MEIVNARITETMLGREDHGIMTFMIFVEMDKGSICGIGGYALDYYDREKRSRAYSSKSMESVAKILDTVGVKTWEELPGKYIRVKSEGWGCCIKEIGHIINDKWFNFEEFFTSEKADF